MECKAMVVEADKRRALVRVARVNCAECGGCGLLARNREHTMEFTAANRLGVRRGDEVIIRVPSHRLSLAYLAVFGMPVVAMAAAYFLGTALFGLLMGGGGQGPGIIAAVIAGIIAFWGGVKLAERIGMAPTILRIVVVPEEEEGRKDGRIGYEDVEGFSGKAL